MKSQKKIPQREIFSLDAPPLNFANFNIRNINDLKYLQPRMGKRKPIMTAEQQDIQEEKKKTESSVSEQNQQGQNNANNQDDNIVKEGEQEDQNKEKEREEEKEKIKEQRGVPSIIRTIQPNTNGFLIQTNVPINNFTVKGNQTKLGEDTQNKQKTQQCKVKLLQTALILSYNKITHLNNFYSIVDVVMQDCKNLQWIDLSHNHLESLDYGFGDFPQLKTLYLHGNYIQNISDLLHIANLQHLSSLTIHGNSIDTIPNFRLYIIGMLPYIKKLDSVLISRKELDNSLVWKANFHQINPPLPKVITRPPNSQSGSKS